jgi:hypothetical protein
MAAFQGTAEELSLYPFSGLRFSFPIRAFAFCTSDGQFLSPPNMPASFTSTAEHLYLDLLVSHGS